MATNSLRRMPTTKVGAARKRKLVKVATWSVALPWRRAAITPMLIAKKMDKMVAKMTIRRVM